MKIIVGEYTLKSEFGNDNRRLYHDLAWTWPIISPPSDYVEEMLGHRLPYDGAYMRATVNRLKEAYMEAYPALSIKVVVVKAPAKEEIDERVKEYLARAGITNQQGSIYKCPYCSRDIDQNWKVCPYCGSDIGITKCPKCEFIISASWKFCPYCKTKLKD